MSDATSIHADFDALMAKYPAALQQLQAAESAAIAALPPQYVATVRVGQPAWFDSGKVPHYAEFATDGTVNESASPFATALGSTFKQFGYSFDFGDPSSAHNQLTGWTAAHVYQTPGDYQTSEGVVHVTPDTRPSLVVQPTQDLASVVAALKVPTRLMLAAGHQYGTAATIHATAPDVTIDATGATVVKHTGPLYITDSTVSWIGGIFSSDAPAATGATKGPTSIMHAINGHPCTMIGAKFGISAPGLPDIQDAVLCDVGISHTFLQDCTADTLSSHYLWGGGTGTVILNGSMSNSTQEMPIRFSDPTASGITIDGGNWANFSSSPTNGKETMTFRMCRQVSVTNATFANGGGFAGWLQTGESNQPGPDRTFTDGWFADLTFSKGAYFEIKAFSNGIGMARLKFTDPSIVLANIRDSSAADIYSGGNTYCPTPGHNAFANLAGAKAIGG